MIEIVVSDCHEFLLEDSGNWKARTNLHFSAENFRIAALNFAHHLYSTLDFWWKPERNCALGRKKLRWCFCFHHFLSEWVYSLVPCSSFAKPSSSWSTRILVSILGISWTENVTNTHCSYSLLYLAFSIHDLTTPFHFTLEVADLKQ